MYRYYKLILQTNTSISTFQKTIIISNFQLHDSITKYEYKYYLIQQNTTNSNISIVLIPNVSCIHSFAKTYCYNNPIRYSPRLYYLSKNNSSNYLKSSLLMQISKITSKILLVFQILIIKKIYAYVFFCLRQAAQKSNKLTELGAQICQVHAVHLRQKS